MKPTFATKVTDSVCVNGWVDQLFYWHQHSGRVQGYSEIRSRSNVWKEHRHSEGQVYMITLTFCCKFWWHTEGQVDMITLTFCCKFWVYSFCIYILGKWLQKEDIARLLCTLFWNGGLKSIQIATIPGCWRQRISGTSRPYICPWNGACKVMQGQSEQYWLLKFLCDQS